MSIEAMKKIVKALEVAEDSVGDLKSLEIVRAAIASGRQAISDFEKQEPVAWRVRRCDAPKYWTVFHHKPIAALQDPEQEVQPLYAEPQSTQENIESIGFYSGRFNGHDLVSLTADIPIGSNLYTHPQPKREWVGLTDEEIAEFFGVKAVDESFVDFVRAIEAAHGITSDMKQEHGDKTAKHRHEWVGLTVMEAVELELATNHPREFAAAIEAKLKQKNGYAEEKNT